MNYLVEAADCYAQLVGIRAKTRANGPFEPLNLALDEVVRENIEQGMCGEKNYSIMDRELIMKLVVEMHCAASNYLDEVHGMGSKDI
jgi:hypothetical protein